MPALSTWPPSAPAPGPLDMPGAEAARARLGSAILYYNIQNALRSPAGLGNHMLFGTNMVVPFYKWEPIDTGKAIDFEIDTRVDTGILTVRAAWLQVKRRELRATATSAATGGGTTSGPSTPDTSGPSTPDT